jgi:hypothetical protein
MDLKDMFTKETIAARKSKAKTQDAILPVSSEIDANLAELVRLRTENAELRAATAKKQKPLSCTVSPKGALSVYGIGRFPVTLYANQWVRLLGASDAIKEFLVANQDKFAHKD